MPNLKTIIPNVLATTLMLISVACTANSSKTVETAANQSTNVSTESATITLTEADVAAYEI